MKNWIIFLDIDGVLNNLPLIFNRTSMAKSKSHEDNHLSQPLILLLNQLITDIDAKVVLSSAWRILYEKDVMNEILKRNGATFEIIDYTDSLPYERGTEISKWLKDNVDKYYDFHKYIIIDDDSDMLLSQREHFFQTDPHAGLTETTCHKIKRFVKKFS